MIDRDFLVFWTSGYNLLHGLNPYAVPESYYPPPMILFFAVFALLPLYPSYGVWTVVNAFLLVRTLKQKMPLSKTFIWFLFTPVIFVLITGHLEIMFFFLASFLTRKGWPAVLAAALLTLKPQIALVVLPWPLLYWLLKDFKSLAKFTGCVLVLWSLPLLISPSLYQNWLMSTGSDQVVNKYIAISPGLFSLTYFSIPFILLAVVSLGIAIYGLTLNRSGSLAANFLATPLGIWYNTALLAGSAPWHWMIPVSWIAFVLAALIQGAYPFAIIPATAFIWMVKNREKTPSEYEELYLPFDRILSRGTH